MAEDEEQAEEEAETLSEESTTAVAPLGAVEAVEVEVELEAQVGIRHDDS